MKVAEAAGVSDDLTNEDRYAATFLAHFGYGAAGGAVYSAIDRALPLPTAAKGLLFGLFVWTASYLGLLPATGILTPATEHPARRNALMILAHFIWGGILALLVEIFRNEAARGPREPLSGESAPGRDVPR
jgi:putative membrane protein